MNPLGHEIRLTQNPALGSVVLWRFTAAYAAAHPQHAPVPLPILFIALPAVWHEQTAMHISSTQVRS
jgi:4-hydroxybenzoate polyprenyltransferase